MSSTANTFGTPSNTVGNLNGFFKETYADSLESLIPDQVVLLNQIKFMPKDRQPGNLFHSPVVLGLEHGVTFGGSEEDAFSLNPPISGQIRDAQVRGNPILLRSLLGYTAASRAAQGTKQAFVDATKFLVSNMLRSLTKKLEIEMLYGQSGYGIVSAVSGADVTISTSEWAPGIWAGAEKMPIEIRDSSGAVSRGEFSVKSVDFENRKITLTSSAASAGVVATDVIHHKGAYGKEFIGIHKILNDQTGDLFNISRTDYALFRGNKYDAGSAALSFTKLNNAVARAVEKGFSGELMVLVNPRAWANMLTDQAALRRFDGSYNRTKLENGSSALEFHSQNGSLKIVPSIYVKEGYAYMLSMEEWERVGSSDVTFKLPGQSDEFFRHLSEQAGFELRLWSDQAVFTRAPARNVLIHGIVNAS